jgi:hypothetical protein
MFRGPGAGEIERVDYVNEDDRRPSRDMLNYSNMLVESSHWAATGTGWMSVLVVIGIAFACVAFMTVVWYMTG